VPDGTQPSPPPTVWDDPVSGLVTGATYEAEPLRIDLATPVEPDLDEVRRAVDAALSAEEQVDEAPVIPAPRRPSAPPAAPAPSPPGIVPPNPRAGWPRTPTVRLPARIRTVRSGGGSGGVSAAVAVGVVVALGVIVVIIVSIVASLVDTITTLFH
jgi:hypothetical protein